MDYTRMEALRRELRGVADETRRLSWQCARDERPLSVAVLDHVSETLDDCARQVAWAIGDYDGEYKRSIAAVEGRLARLRLLDTTELERTGEEVHHE